jgi:hypothetical protein
VPFVGDVSFFLYLYFVFCISHFIFSFNTKHMGPFAFPASFDRPCSYETHNTRLMISHMMLVPHVISQFKPGRVVKTLKERFAANGTC